MSKFSDMKKKEELKKIPGMMPGLSFGNVEPVKDYSAIPDSLEEIEKEIIELKQNLWENFWHIGKRLIHIQERILKDQDIYDYAYQNFDFSRSTAWRSIYLASNFNSISALKWGSKLYLLNKLNDLEKQKYLDWMEKSNPTYREIEEQIKKDYPPPHRPKQDINLSQSRMIVDFKRMGVRIKKEKQNDFLDRLDQLIREFCIELD